MAKPKAPIWLCEAFRDGIDDHLHGPGGFNPMTMRPPAYRGALGLCWLAQFDPSCRCCDGPLERFHFIPRQRVENALGALLPTEPPVWSYGQPESWVEIRAAVILVAAWDARNGGIGCQVHHRRFDSHATPPLSVPRSALPSHVEEFAADWDLESELERKFR